MISCPECDQLMIRTISGWANCRVPGHARLHSRGLLNALVEDAWLAAKAAGETNSRSPRRFQAMAWRILRREAGSPARKKPEKPKQEYPGLFEDCDCTPQGSGVERKP